MENINDKEYEARRKAIMERRKAKQKKARKAFLKRLTVLVSVIAVIALVVLSLTLFFPLNSIKVTGKPVGNVSYTEKQIIEASGIKIGQNFFTSGSNAEENITLKLPYIATAKVNKSFPSEAVISVTYAKESICYTVGREFYICDGESKLLQISKTEPKNLILIKGSSAAKTEVGNKVAFGNNDTFNICKKLRDTEKLGVKVDSIDVTDLMKLTVRIDGRFTVNFGSSGNLDKKLAHLQQMLKNIDKKLIGTIDLSGWTAENPKAIFTQGA